MIKALEKDFLRDNYILKEFISNISIKDKIYFNKNDIYYFGDYDEEILKIVKRKLLKNKKAITKAIENNIKFIIHGNSIKLFNNTFINSEFNLFTAYDKKEFVIRRKKIKHKKKSNNKYIVINNLKQGIDSLNFRYKNFICIK